MTIEEECLEYIHEQFFKLRNPENGSNYIPTEEDWARMPQFHKEQMVKLVLGFRNGADPMIEKIKLRLGLKDNELGMYVKNLLKQ